MFDKSFCSIVLFCYMRLASLVSESRVVKLSDISSNNYYELYQ